MIDTLTLSPGLVDTVDREEHLVVVQPGLRCSPSVRAGTHLCGEGGNYLIVASAPAFDPQPDPDLLEVM